MAYINSARYHNQIFIFLSLCLTIFCNHSLVSCPYA